MKKILFLLFFIHFSWSAFPQDNAIREENSFDFAITHPTVANLERIFFLIDHKIIDLPQPKILAVYYDMENYDYSKSILYLNEHDTLNIVTIQKMSGVLNKENLFINNGLSLGFEQIFNRTNGILFFGGDDIPPVTYGEKMDLTTRVADTYRHFFELSFLYHLIGGFQAEQSFEPLLERNPAYLIWAFCLGMQTMNVAAGGTLVQDIPSEIYSMQFVEDILNQPENNVHKNYFRVLHPELKLEGSKLHQLFIPDSSFLYQFTSDNNVPSVNSYHHQCVDNLGKGLFAIAFSMDKKIVEAVKHHSYKHVIGFQFHPEKIELYNPDKKLFLSPKNSSGISYYEILKQDNSYNFHVNLWKGFSKTFVNFRTSKM